MDGSTLQATTELDLVTNEWSNVVPGLHEYLLIDVATGDILGYPHTETKAERFANGTPSQRAHTRK